jgi:HD-GYP domain-containing protein (c-di-GMP phosphodiesterase class II)
MKSHSNSNKQSSTRSNVKRKRAFPAFVAAPPQFIPLTDELEVDIYIQTLQTSRLFLFRRKGQSFDRDALKELLDLEATIYITGSDWPKVIHQKADILADLVLYGATSERVSTQAADNLARLLIVHDVDDVPRILADFSRLVERLISNMDRSSLHKTYASLHDIVEKQKGHFLHHALQVSSMSVIIGMILGIKEPRELGDLAIAGFLHDVGFSGLDSKVIESYFSQGKLHVAESEQYLKHPETGIELAESRGIPISIRVREAVLEHHERLDGSGFPLGLRGDQIGLHSRILAIADEFVGALTLTEGSKVVPQKIFDDLIEKKTVKKNHLDSFILNKLRVCTHVEEDELYLREVV